MLKLPCFLVLLPQSCDSLIFLSVNYELTVLVVASLFHVWLFKDTECNFEQHLVVNDRSTTEAVI